jgi:hypothetical protein
VINFPSESSIKAKSAITKQLAPNNSFERGEVSFYGSKKDSEEPPLTIDALLSSSESVEEIVTSAPYNLFDRVRTIISSPNSRGSGEEKTLERNSDINDKDWSEQDVSFSFGLKLLGHSAEGQR